MSLTLRFEKNGISILRRGHNNKNKALRISYTLQIQETQQSISASNDTKYSNQQILIFHAIIGIKLIKNIPFVIIVKQHENISAFHGGQVYEIKSIDWIPLTKDIQKLDDAGLESQLNSISKIFQQGLHYYSDNYSLYRPFLLNVTKNSIEQQEEAYYSQFIWNDNVMRIDANNQHVKELYAEKKLSYKQQQKLFASWCTPIIQGYVNMFEVILPDKVKLQYVLISRRSYKKAGTRFFSRGIDDYGNVANYTQTQYIIQYSDTIMTHIQLRGSVPVFFQQIGVEGINIELNIQRSKQLTKKPFISHFNTVLSHYNRTLCINLLSQKKKSQLKLSKFYQQMITSTKPYLSQVRYQYFDFHQQCKNNQFENTQRLIEKIRQTIKNFGFNCFNLQSGKLVKKQTGVMRTNCLDCLDRTNYVQSRVSLEVLKEMLINFTSQVTKRNVLQFSLLQQTDVELNSQLLNKFNLLWAQNGDSVSLHYTGIGSTHTDITKIGKRTLFGTVNHKMRSLMRFYTQFTDVKKHETINAFLGNKSLVKFDKNNSQQQKKTKQQNLLVLSWQFTDPQKSLYEFEKNPYNSKTYQQLMSQLREQLGNRYMLIVVYLYIPNELVNWQSGINFDIKSLLNPFKSQPYSQLISKWADFITTQLQSIKQRYILIDSNQHSSCRMLIFCKKNQLQAISNIKKDQITSSMKTKQVVLLTKFKLYQSPLVFQAFNVKNMSSFADFLQKTHEKGFQQSILGRSKSTTVSEQSYRLILGNVGSETKLTQNEFNRLQNKFQQLQNSKNVQSTNLLQLQAYQEKHQQNQSITSLIGKGCQHDQLKQLLQGTQLLAEKKIKMLANYNEAMLEFIPGNNRVLFWNEQGKIVRAKSYKKITQSQFGSISFKKPKQKSTEQVDMLACYPTYKQQRLKQTQSCVCLQLSYEIDELSG